MIAAVIAAMKSPNALSTAVEAGAETRRSAPRQRQPAKRRAGETKSVPLNPRAAISTPMNDRG